jgi:hypothetical protein
LIEAAGHGIAMMSAGGFATPILLRLGRTALMSLMLVVSNASLIARCAGIAGYAR